VVKVYAQHAGKYSTILMHRFILGIEDMESSTRTTSIQVDHIDGNGLNNVRKNLRMATSIQNRRNRILNSNNSSGYKGVYFNPYSRVRPWLAAIKADGKKNHLGSFSTPQEAHAAYRTAAVDLHKEFANFGYK